MLYPKAGVSHFVSHGSNHCPIWMDTSMEYDFLPRPFRFEAIWTREAQSTKVVRDAWNKFVECTPGLKLT